jgi:hypothetical protein
MGTERPRLLFGSVGFLFLFVAFILAIPLLFTYFSTGLVPRLPTAVLCVCLVLLAAQIFAFGWLLHSVRRGRIENKRLAYLAQKGCPRKKRNTSP